MTIESLATRAIKLMGEKSNEVEKFCWMVVHEHCNGVMPVEYDIREVDEDLYLEVLNRVRNIR